MVDIPQGAIQPRVRRNVQFVATLRAGIAAVGASRADTGAVAQESMGESWRIGVDASETTRLIDNGVFKLVRNPIFTAMLIFGAGVALLAPNGLALLAFATLATSIELQVRIVEEPYLRRTHGLHYAEYTSRVGRFIPGLGRSSTTV